MNECPQKESWDLRSMHLGLASLESIAMSIGAVKELDLGGQNMWATKNNGMFLKVFILKKELDWNINHHCPLIRPH